MLEVVSATVSYGRHRAIENVSIHVAKGEICVILGANGAGKSTLLKTIAGMVKAAPGIRVSMNGRVISGMKPHEIVEAGVALVPEGRGVFGELTVSENLRLGAYPDRARPSEAENLERVLSLFPRLAERRSQIVRSMSGGEQQMVAIGRALMSNPDILMLDEPSLGLSPRLTSELFKSLQRVGATGMGILLVEQNARQSLAIAGRGYLLENGHIVGEDSAANLLNDPAVQQAYLGVAAKGPAPARPIATHATAASFAPSPKPHGAPPAPAMPPLGSDAASVARGIGDLVARAAASQTEFVRDGGARAGHGAVPPANGFHPTAERDIQTIIAEMEAAARRARLIGEAEAKLPPAKSQLARRSADAAQRSGGD